MDVCVFDRDSDLNASFDFNDVLHPGFWRKFAIEFFKDKIACLERLVIFEKQLHKRNQVKKIPPFLDFFKYVPLVTKGLPIKKS